MNKDEVLFTPSDTIRYVAENRKVPVEALKVPERLLITYHRSTYESAKNLIRGKFFEWIYGEIVPFCVGRYNNIEVAVSRFHIGAPAAVMILEEAIACGAAKIFEVGLSGGLQEFLKPADIVIVTEAIRDEGTSHHYFPPDVKVESSPQLRELLIKCLNDMKIRHFVGSVWSTDGAYRETVGKYRRFRDNGVLAVNMETSAIFAVAKYRNVEAASAQVISDILAEGGWLQAFYEKSVRESIEVLLKAVLETLSKS
ncbi:MAG: nucleoside phosphorylase [Candidatus Bathyarchaeia archaeon]